jgi:ribonuclease Z
MIRIKFLGTTGSKPTKYRGLPAIVVEFEKETLLLDCGEGTQRQMLIAGINPNKIKNILITHLHGDHFFGLPGVIWSMGLDMRREDLNIYGPKGIKKFLEFLDDFLKPYRNFSLKVFEIEEGKIYETEEYEVFAIKVKHSTESFAYKIKEKDKPPKILKEKLEELKIPKGPFLRDLKLGKEVRLKDGRIIRPSDVLGESRKGKIIVYSGDAAPTKPLVEFSFNADVLIHEATFGDEEESKAREYRHSTARDAAKIAKEANVKNLILTHISARYEKGDQLLAESTEVFPNTFLAQDFFEFVLK